MITREQIERYLETGSLDGVILPLSPEHEAAVVGDADYGHYEFSDGSSCRYDTVAWILVDVLARQLLVMMGDSDK